MTFVRKNDTALLLIPMTYSGNRWHKSTSGVARNLRQGVHKVVLPSAFPSLSHPTFLFLIPFPFPSLSLEVGPLNTARDLWVRSGVEPQR